ncbi:hypothetical protein LCGC14_0896890 [marine sediment metagenome]|uniref:Uncharacterized protein n=1 Tax=marine sediment metagenome TaxID=412755 RepID=A0A0F9P2F3_9ZZZZ
MRKVKIGAHTYEVREVEDHFESGDLGQCDYAEQVIMITKGLKPEQYFAILLHEAMEVMNTSMRHDILDSLAEQIAQFLLDNKLICLKKL